MIPNAAKNGVAIPDEKRRSDGAAVNLVPFVDCCRIQRGGSGAGGGGDKLLLRSTDLASCLLAGSLPAEQL